MHLEYGFAPLHVRIVHGYLPVEPAGPQKSGVEYIGPVRCSKHDYAFVYGKTVHLNEQLVKRLFPFVVSAAKARAALAANGVYLVYKHYRRSAFLGS